MTAYPYGYFISSVGRLCLSDSHESIVLPCALNSCGSKLGSNGLIRLEAIAKSSFEHYNIFPFIKISVFYIGSRDPVLAGL